MKTIIKWFSPLILLALLTISCEENSLNPDQISTDRVHELTDKALLSTQFKNLNIPLGALSPDKSLFINSEKKSVYIPFKDLDEHQGVIALFDDNYYIKGVAFYEALTPLSSDLIVTELKNGSFSGGFVFRTESGGFEIQMSHSKIVSFKALKNKNTTARVLECAGMTEAGGALWCAGSRLENMNWWDSAACYANFIPCMGGLVISCAIDNCVVNPSIAP